MSRSTPWIAGAAVLSVAIAGIGWVTLISPKLTTAAQTREQVETVEASNVQLKLRTDELREQFAKIGTYEAELATLQQQVPTAGRTDELLQRVHELAAERGLTVTEVAVAGASLITAEAVADAQPAPVEPPAAEEPAEGEESAEDEGTAEAASDAAPAPHAGSTSPAAGLRAVEGLSQVPVSLTVLGPADAVRDFTAALRTGMDRLLLVSAFAAESQPDTTPSQGRPATVVGDVSATLTGFTYVLDDTRPTVEPELEQVAPLPVPGANPFSPLDPTR